jgi:Fe-S-cluster containining protein
MKKKNRKCVFLKNGGCSIYMHRPLLCRFSPFSLEKNNGGYIFKATDECPGIGTGNNLGEDDFKEMLTEANGVLAKAF